MEIKTCPTCGVHIDQHEALACLDTWAGTDVMGWETNGITWCIPGTRDRYPGYGVEHWRPSKDIAAAWQVVEKKLADGWNIMIDSMFVDGTMEWDCVFVKWVDGEQFWSSGSAETSTLAICRAAIKAMEAK